MKSVLITGTSKGIGFETALSFARGGYKVFATMRNPDAAASLKKYIADESLAVIIYKMDVDSDESVKHCIETIIKEHGTIDVLINNAGIERHGSIEELPLADFKAIMETNYFGVIRCTQAVLPQMRKNKNGCIINVGSVSGKIACTPLSAYSASKFALEALTESLAQEVKPFNIRVSLMQPGIIDTKMAHDISVDSHSEYPQVLRFGAMFEETLKQPTPPSLVADAMLEIANGEAWQLKHPVGPSAIPFLGWRASMTDEQWVDWNAQTDEEWYNAVQTTFGMNVRRGK
jgi:NAD(P)-dependent dehydrogenase (short-subunit alcohol dehydrogenase family)